MKLYEIADEIERVLASEVDPETGEITDDTIAKLDALEMERDQKALWIARYLLGEKTEAEAVKSQADRLARRAQVHANRAERLKQYIGSNIPVGHKLRDDVVQIGWRKSTAVEIVDEKKLPDEYWRIHLEPDKAKAKEALKKGNEVPGAELLIRQHVSIR